METRKLKLGLPFSCFLFSLFYFLVASPLAAAQFAPPSPAPPGLRARPGPPSDPQPPSGHPLRFRAQKQTGGRTLDVSCRLYQGTTAISPVRTLASLGTTYTTHTYP